MTVPLGIPPQSFLTACETHPGRVLIRISPEADIDVLPALINQLLTHCTDRRRWTVEARDDLSDWDGPYQDWEVWELAKDRP